MNILVIANCRLGDSLVMLPAFKLLRGNFPQAHIALASEAPGPGFVAAKDILGGRGVIDDFIAMPSPKSRIARLLARMRFIRNLRKIRWDIGIVLMPPYPPLTLSMVGRLRLYLRLAGARRILAPKNIALPQRDADGRLLPMPSVVDATLAILAPLGFALPAPGQADAALPAAISQDIPVLPGRRRIAVAPGANMPAKCWAAERFAAVLIRFCGEHDAVPVYLGGINETALCEQLNRQVPGMTVVGRPLAVVEAVLRKCDVFLGNDTGLGHLAAAVGLPCVSVFSCRDIPGIWEPYTDRKAVLRAHGIPCEGCLKTACAQSPQPCLDTITPDMVLERLEALFE